MNADVKLNVHLASLREPRLEEFPVGGRRNKLKVRLRIRNLPALLVLATGGSAQMRGFATGVGSKADVGAGQGPPRRSRDTGIKPSFHS